MQISVKIHKMKKDINGDGMTMMFQMLSDITSLMHDAEEHMDLVPLLEDILYVCEKISDFISD